MEDDQSDGDSESPNRAWHTMVGTYIFGTLLLAFFVYVFTIGPDKLPEFKQRMLGLSCALLAGLFAYFLTGEIRLKLPEMGDLIGEKSRASGGVGVFALVLLWWSSPLAPIGLAETVDSIKTDTVAIRSDTKEIRQGVGELGRLGGLIKDPQTPADFYHNARVQELGGRFSEAFADYEKYATSNQIFVDPFISFLQLLRTQQGNENAVETFASLRKRFPDNLAIEYVYFRLLSGSHRLAALEEFAKRHAEFGPAILDIADHYSSARMPDRTGVDAERERNLLREFIRSAESGNFDRFYIDKHLAARLLDDARGRLVSQESPDSGLVAKEKVFLNGGEIWVMDPSVVSISYSFDGLDWHPTPNLIKTLFLGRGAIADQRYGDETHRRVFARYTDQKGHESRVYELRSEDDKTRAYQAKMPPPRVAPISPLMRPIPIPPKFLHR